MPGGREQAGVGAASLLVQDPTAICRVATQPRELISSPPFLRWHPDSETVSLASLAPTYTVAELKKK